MSGKTGLPGSLLYAACMTRPDIAFITAYLCQFMQASVKLAGKAQRRNYLNTTKELGISFGGDVVLRFRNRRQQEAPDRLQRRFLRP